MAFLDRSQIVPTSDRATGGARQGVVRRHPAGGADRDRWESGTWCRRTRWRPLIVTLLFAVGAVTAGFALLCRRDRFRIMWFDLAGSLTFIGVVLSVLIEPDQMVRLFALSDQPE